MSDQSPHKGVPGILRPFRQYLETNKFGKGDQVVYYGVPGTCTPFIELLAFAVRGLGLEQVFVPFFKEEKAKKIIFVEGVGMQISPDHMVLMPGAQVIMGGLAMPNVPVTVGDAKRMLARHKDSALIGICFNSMFEKADWMNEISFDILIDAIIDPVRVSEQTRTLSERSKYLISSYDRLSKKEGE
ncbi:MAG: DUF2124 family protein [Methanomicrobiales archaeon]|nr:DUF2124 family protein [Methanomicrobiales archaeon]